MARPAKTIRQHLLEGTVPQGTPDKPSQFHGGRPKYPKHLSSAAKAEFKRAVQTMEQRGTITPGDYAALAVYAEVAARWIQAKREMGDDLMVETTVTDNNGNLRLVSRLNPLLKIVQACEARLQSLTKSLGLTPVDREKARPTRRDEEERKLDPMEQFLDRKPMEIVPAKVVPIAPPDSLDEPDVKSE